MATNIFLPQWGMGMQEATIIKWLKKEGDIVKKGDPLVEVESSKVNAEVESSTDGYLIKISAEEGQVIKVGGIIAYVGEKDEKIQSEANKQLNENNTSEKITVPKDQKIKVQITPIARKVARELNIDLDKVMGSGPNGRITETDVRNYGSSDHNEKDLNLISGIRKVIAARMTESNSIPSVTLTSKVDITNCVNYQNELLKEWRKEKIRPTFQDLIVKSVALSLVEHKIFNAHFLDNEIKQFDEINLGIAYALKDGLVVPVIKNSHNKSLLEIAKNIREFSIKEKKGFSQEDISGSTFSITSLNSTVVDSFNPLINPPEVGILGIGRTSEEIFITSGKQEIRKICYFNLTFDHRAVDGFPASKFLESIIKNIQNPEALEIK